MEQAKISSFQLFCLILLFELGTAIIAPIGLDAHQDAWIAVLIGMLIGLPIYWMYVFLYNRYPGLLLTGYARTIFGPLFGWIAAFAYILFFIYGAARDLRDGLELLMLSMDLTPMFLLGAMLMVIVVYALFTGVETFSRLGEIYTFFLVFAGLAAFFFLLFSNVLNTERILPVLEKGLMPVFTAVYGQTVMFPFGEMICFTMILPYLNDPKSGFKVGTSAILISGIIIALVVFLEIATLGIYTLERSTFPLLAMIQRIRVGEFIQRLDALAVTGLIINDFIKVTVFSYAALIGAADLFKQPKNRLVIPISVMTLVLSLLIARNVEQHFQQGRIALKNIFPVFALVIPLLLVITELIRSRLSAQKNG
ncbi:GerAB/ArcD/ProY family transporter [Paenibacillus beijingensis]|uniref:Uncharacterized protein n=1 Tax=Paenibacillus beijingensis TaxID=1126833 RepID=A0A0D5NIN5_9BACL|nr:GerAB/ArcD/ProY family transporter [Paenibacillus beijingensis]AJY75116.1 hypothetical protein VN24_11680 [Paenibacillus beijingensis]